MPVFPGARHGPQGRGKALKKESHPPGRVRSPWTQDQKPGSCWRWLPKGLTDGIQGSGLVGSRGALTLKNPQRNPPKDRASNHASVTRFQLFQPTPSALFLFLFTSWLWSWTGRTAAAVWGEKATSSDLGWSPLTTARL